MLYATYLPNELTPGRSGPNVMCLPLHTPPRSYVRRNPQVLRTVGSSPLCGHTGYLPRHACVPPGGSQMYTIPPHVMNGALGLAGNLLDSLLARNSTTSQHSHCQQNHGDEKVPYDDHQTSNMLPAEPVQPATKDQGHVEQKQAEGCCAENREGCCPPKRKDSTTLNNDKNPSQVWMQPISLQGFSPSQVRVRVGDGKVHIHARMEKSSGPGPCLSGYEMMRTVKLPDDVDQQTVSCIMVTNGNLLLYAPRMTRQELEDKNGKPEPAANQPAEEKQRKEEEGKQVLPEEKDQNQSSGKRVEVHTEPKDNGIEKNAFANLAEKTFDQLKQPTSEETSDDMSATKLATEAPKRLAEMGTEILQELENEHQESRDDKHGSLETAPIVEEPDSDQSFEMQPEDNVSAGCCCMGDEEFEMISTGSLTDTTSLDAEEETSGDNAQKTPMTAEAPEKTNNEKRDENSNTPEKASETAKETCALHENTSETPKPENDTDPTPPVKSNPMDDKLPEPNHTYTRVPENVASSSDDQANPFCTLISLRDYRPQDLRVQLKDLSLIVSAEREGNLGGMVFIDRTQRHLELPLHIDPESVRCVLREDGMLVVTALPKCSHRQIVM